jgi:ubiquinone/menaquinone biosynthesis C-methylase UbiE
MSLEMDEYLEWHRLCNEMMTQYCAGRDSCYGLVLDLIGSLLKFPNKTNMLDVGCGSGVFTEKVIAHFSEAKITAIDYSAKNLHIAQKVVGENRVSWILQDLTAPEWDKQLRNGSFDVAFIGWVTHVIEPWHLNQFYKNIASALREGGLLFNVDFMSRLKPSFRDMATNVVRKRITNDFDLFDKNFSKKEAITKLQGEDNKQRTAWNVRHDVDYHIKAIEAASFKDAEEIWRYLNSSLILAIR